jgi:hypothetical protein
LFDAVLLHRCSLRIPASRGCAFYTDTPKNWQRFGVFLFLPILASFCQISKKRILKRFKRVSFTHLITYPHKQQKPVTRGFWAK